MNELERLSQAEHMLAVIARADDAAKLADLAEAARVYARKAELGTAAVNHATVIKARALKRMAELVDEGQERGEIASRETFHGNQWNVTEQDTPPVTLPDLGISRQRLHEARKMEPLSDSEIAEVATRANEAGRETSVAEIVRVAEQTKSPLAVHFSTGEDDWHTPPDVVNAVVAALGAIDLDPCSNGGAPNIPASGHYTAEDDGLAHEWCGRVYMNPPYGRPIAEWVHKLCSEHESGRVSEAIALVPARTDTEWFQRLRNAAICFIDGRLKFSGHTNSAPFPSAACYLGGNLESFADAFEELGDIWVRWER